MKKFILTAALSLTLVGSAFAPLPARAQDDGPDANIVVVENTVTVEEVRPDAPTTAGELPQSGVARKMTQAEKAHNAEVNDSWGGAITIIAMTIVVSALLVLSLLFLAFGKISEKLLSLNKRKAAKAAAAMAADARDDSHEVDSGEVIAAISMALAEHFQGGHDYEDTILTIRRMKRAYSPWNSKIYNLRITPPLHRNGFGL